MKQIGVANSSLSGYVSVEKSSRIQPRNVEKVWASFDDDNQGLISEDKKEWMHFTDSSKADTSSLSSEAESVEDIWSISEELRTYYLNQFITMQPDIKGVILGSVAKEFFEKSKLPTSQLSKIWQLSDVNKDGALNLEEFNTAMHLVVCRINGMELPDQLPHSLQPYVPFTNSDEPFACDLPPGSTLKRLTPSSPGKPQPPPFTQPSPSSSSVPSPGQKPTPVNFEFRPITEDQDSMIAHPVALRMSPDGQAFPLDSNGKPIAHAPTQPENAVSGDAAQAEVETNPYADAHLAHLQGRPRPTPKKAQSVPAPGQESAMLSPSFPPPPPISSQDTAAAAMDVPVPPPRIKSHSRSSSLDANQVLQSPDTVDGAPISPPVVPPRPKEGCSSNEMSSSTLSASVTSPSDDKAVTPQHSGDELNAASKVLPKLDSQQTKDLRQRIKEQKEKNLTLSRLNVELNSEMQEVMEQRIALEIQMEHLRPYGAGY